MGAEKINFDPFPAIRNLYTLTERKFSFKAKNREEVLTWQKKWRKKLLNLLGNFPSPPFPLKSEVLDKKEFPGYTREAVSFYSKEGMKVFSYFLIPHNVQFPSPALICLPGHGRGVDDIVGIKKDGSMRKRAGGYMRDFALQSVKKGFVVLAIEQLGFGHRREAQAIRKGSSASSCNPLSGSLLLLGETMIGWRVYDVIRAVDYLETRKEVNREKIGIMGISGGGTISLFSAAVEERIKAAVISGYFCTFYHSIFSLVHCIDNYIPGILQYGEMHDVAGLIAPRALFIEAGKKDPIFPLEGVKEGINKIKKIYQTMKAEGKLDWEIFDGEHRIYGKKCFTFLKKNLGSARKDFIP